MGELFMFIPSVWNLVSQRAERKIASRLNIYPSVLNISLTGKTLDRYERKPVKQ
jgi:hypothetical protein